VTPTLSTIRSKFVRRKASVVAVILLALLAFVPSMACACLETYRLSPLRMVISAQLFGVLLIALLAIARNRAGWVTLSGLVLAGSSFAAMLVAGVSQSLIAAGLVVLTPVYLLAVLVWARSKSAI
jgi:hypothetical protein